MGLGIGSLIASGIGGALQIGGARKREKAVDSVLGGARRESERSFQELRDQSDALGRVFEQLAAERGESVDEFLERRSGPERVDFARRHGDDALIAIQDSVNQALQGIEPPDSAVPVNQLPAVSQSQEVHRALRAPFVQSELDVGEQEALRRGRSMFDQINMNDLLVQLAEQDRIGEERMAITGIERALEGLRSRRNQAILEQDMQAAQSAGDNLALLGSLFQLSGLGLGAASAFQRPDPQPMPIMGPPAPTLSTPPAAGGGAGVTGPDLPLALP